MFTVRLRLQRTLEFSHKFNAARRVVGQHATLSTVSWCHLSAGDTQSRGADVKTASASRRGTRGASQRDPREGREGTANPTAALFPQPLSSHRLHATSLSTLVRVELGNADREVFTMGVFTCNNAMLVCALPALQHSNTRKCAARSPRCTRRAPCRRRERGGRRGCTPLTLAAVRGSRGRASCVLKFSSWQSPQASSSPQERLETPVRRLGSCPACDPAALRL